jgi:hypothetical protein
VRIPHTEEEAARKKADDEAKWQKLKDDQVGGRRCSLISCHHTRVHSLAQEKLKKREANIATGGAEKP